jgi:Na+-transporting NADH:ubiquinone oxidoreductase subunit NqrC
MRILTFLNAISLFGCALLVSGCGKSLEERQAEQVVFDQDTTVLASCSYDSISRIRVSEVKSRDTEQICEAMVTTLRRNPSVRLLREMSRAVSTLTPDGATEEKVLNTRHFMRIAKARGQLSSDDAMISTFNVVFKIVTGMKGRVTMAELAEFMEQMGLDAQAMSDEGLTYSAAALSAFKTR